MCSRRGSVNMSMLTILFTVTLSPNGNNGTILEHGAMFHFPFLSRNNGSGGEEMHWHIGGTFEVAANNVSIMKASNKMSACCLGMLRVLTHIQRKGVNRE